MPSDISCLVIQVLKAHAALGLKPRSVPVRGSAACAEALQAIEVDEAGLAERLHSCGHPLWPLCALQLPQHHLHYQRGLRLQAGDTLPCR